jgi:hypothetical protein
MRVDNDDVKLKDVKNLCGTLDKMLEEKDGILQALKDSNVRQSLSVSLFGFVNIGVEFSLPQKWLVELASVIRKMVGLKAKRIEILIRGFADGQTHPWQERLQDGYPYNKVLVYEPLEAWRVNWFDYVRAEDPVGIPNPYTNDDLPDLRARFVREEIIERLLKDCEFSAETEVHILKGRADKGDAIDEKQRKTMIFVNIY